MKTIGLLNSKLLYWRLQSISNPFRGGWITCTKQYVETLPIRTIDFNHKDDKALHDKIVQLVETILAHHKELQTTGLDSQEKRSIERDIAATDKAIDNLVYQLYGLTEKEIKIIEAA